MCCPEDGTSERWLSWFEAATSERRKKLGQVLRIPTTICKGAVLFLCIVYSLLCIYIDGSILTA